MFKTKIVLILCSLVWWSLSGCEHSTPLLDDSIPDGFDGVMTAGKNGLPLRIFICANPNGYKNNEVVLRGSGKGLDRILMLTFALPAPRIPGVANFSLPTPSAAINTPMTGFWDLGFCHPTRRYLLQDNAGNAVAIESYDPATKTVRGTFSLTVRNEAAPHDVIVFANGKFQARLKPEKFEY